MEIIEERISKLEVKTIEFTQYDRQRENRPKKKKKKYRALGTFRTITKERD